MKKLIFVITLICSITILTSCKDINPINDEDISEYTTTEQTTTEHTTITTSESTTETTSEETSEETTEETSETTVHTTEATTKETTATTAATTTETTVATTTTVLTTTIGTTQIVPPVITNPVNYTPLNYNNQKGVWFAYLDLNPNLKEKTESQFRAYIDNAFNNVHNLGCNTVYVHVRAFGDAYYNSSYYPWSNYSSGPGSNPGYDPLEIMIDAAHSKGLSFHAWVNPMRLMTDENMKNIPDNYLVKQWYNSSSKKGKYIVKPSNSNYYWLNPAYEDVRNLINSGISEILQKYKVDGIHIDDYFYPTTDSSFDSDAYALSGETNLSNWRMSNIDKLVSGIYSTKEWINPEVLFGVSPQGNMGNNYTYMYADVKKWCSQSGFLDYIVPQIYFGFTNKWQPFETCANEWNNIIKLDSVNLIIGLAPYKIGTTSDDWSNSHVLSNQIALSQSLSRCNGVALYRYDSMFTNVSSFVSTEVGYIKDSLT